MESPKESESQSVWSLEKGLTRRGLFRGAAIASVGLAGAGLLGGCTGSSTAANTSSTAATPVKSASSRRKLDAVKPVGTTQAEAWKWWCDQLKTNSAKIDQLALTVDEVEKVKGMGLKVAFLSWGFASKGSAFMYAAAQKRATDLGIELHAIQAVGSTATIVKNLVDMKIDAVVGSIGVPNSKEAGEVTKGLYDAGIPTIAYSRPASDFYPTLITVMVDRQASGAYQAGLMAKKIAAAGFKSAKVGVLKDPEGAGYFG